MTGSGCAVYVQLKKTEKMSVLARTTTRSMGFRSTHCQSCEGSVQLFDVMVNADQCRSYPAGWGNPLLSSSNPNLLLGVEHAANLIFVSVKLCC